MNPTGLLATHPAWLRQLHAAAERPPARPRLPLWWRHATIGSVEAEWVPRVQAGGVLQPAQRNGQPGFEVVGELSPALAQLADALRAAGLAHAWRNEPLAVTDEAGTVLGSVERAVVRTLGVATRAVHLIGLAPSGAHWVQQRSLTKPNDPGLWDTLMGGMVPACDTLEQALARETWEEAGLQLAQLQGLAFGGTLHTRRPSTDGVGGFLVERIDWFHGRVPNGVTPVNQDGEVAQFCCMEPVELVAALVGGDFTLEAALVFAASGV